MEYCQHVSCLTKTIEIDLKQALLRLHKFKIIHFDIKPDNICFSQTFNKYVFIDFGLSKLVI